MLLKDYQTATLATLRRFFEEARLRGPKAAYEAIVGEPEQAKRLHGFGGAYTPLLGQEDMPYVCLRLPTGGGKTLLAAHSVKLVAQAWIGTDYPLVLWLVPTTTIRKQTVEALNNPRHPYRQALAEAFGEPVRIFDIGDFTRLHPHDLGRHLCIFVGTIQTLRVTDTDGRKVYAHHEALEPFFSKIDKRLPGLETLGAETAAKVGGDANDIRYSFANLLHLHRPLMIVDEAHKAVTSLSRDMQARVNPTAIVEFTATPHAKSNILHSVSALELKDEQMIKLPVVLAEHHTWEGAVTGAIAKRAELADEASRDRAGYIRPIVLFQAEDKNREVTVEVLRQHLIDVHRIDPRSIAVATGDQRGLDGIDLFDPNADPLIDYIITVEALKEGWDCSFAYVFCSVANIRSATDAEQLLGRVLRMPYATRRKSPMLNKAYANLISKSFAEAATTLRDRLVQMGFEEKEAEENIEAERHFADDDADGLWGLRRRAKPSVRIPVSADPAQLEQARAAAAGKISIERDAEQKPALRVTGFMRAEEIEKVAAALPAADAERVREEVARFHAEHAHSASAAERGETFVVPALMAQVQGELIFADSERLSEYVDWSLRDVTAQLTPAEFDVTETSDGFEIDLDGDTLTLRATDQSDQLLLDVPVNGWTTGGLVSLLARQVRADDIPAADMIRWLTEVVAFLTEDRRIPLSALMRCRFILARKLKDRIAAARQAVRRNAYQTCLFSPDASPRVSFDRGFRFFDGMFAGVPRYRGAYRFSKHFLGDDQVAAFDGKDEGGDEFKAAQQIDALPEVDYWVRNVSGHPNAFKLPTATGWTFPDFIAKLTDGRILVVEYKGEHLVKDAAEKRAVGELWQAASDGKGVYVFARKDVAGKTVRDQIREALAAG